MKKKIIISIIKYLGYQVNLKEYLYKENLTYKKLLQRKT